MIAVLAEMERRVRRFLEGTSASAHLGGPAGPASWVGEI